MRKIAFALILLALTVAVVSSLSLVYAEDVAPTMPLQPIFDIFSKVGYAAPVAVLVGLLTSLLGWASKTTPEDFKLVNMVYTIIVSLIIGVGTVYGGWTYSMLDQWLGNGALTLWIYWMAKIIAKKLQWNTPAPTGPPALTA
jgi:MFS family permease